MDVDYSRVPVWMDNVFDNVNRERSPQLSFRVCSEDRLEEVFEEEPSNGCHRQIVTSGDGTHSRCASSSCGSPGVQTLQAVSNPDVTANSVYLSAPSTRTKSYTNIVKESRMKKLKRRLSEGFLRLSVSPSPKEPSPGPHGSSPSTSRSLERPIANKQRSQRPKSLAFSPTEEIIPVHLASGAPPSYATIGPSRPISHPTKAFGSTGSLPRRRYSEVTSPFGRLETYRKLEPLGEGSYATVFRGVSSINGQLVAMKEIRLNSEEGTPFTAIREASLLKELKHANIVTLHDIVHTSSNLTFVFEYVDTDLSHYMEKHPGPLNPHNVQLFMFQLLRGLAFCHNRKILHRDLKPQNILISVSGELKLADFGLARAKSVPTRTYSHEVVTLWYRPPDVLMGSIEYSTPLDMWGVGCIFVEMLTGKPLFPGIKGVSDQLNKIWTVLGTPTTCTWPGITSYSEYKPHQFKMCPPKLLESISPLLSMSLPTGRLATQMIQLIPSQRISAPDSLHHEYFSTLPELVYTIPDSTSIYVVPGITFHK